MEVASNQTVLLQRKNQRVSLPGDMKRSLQMNPRTESPRPTTSNGSSQPTQNSQTIASLDVHIPSSSASDASDPSPALMSLTPPPENETEKNQTQQSQEQDISPGGSTQAEPAPKKRRRRVVPDDGLKGLDGAKWRITRNREDANEVVVNNYVDVAEKRQAYPRVVPPTGFIRMPFKPPKGDLEKEKDKLKIHMVGPKTKTSMRVIENINKAMRIHNVISEGPEFQAQFDMYLAEEYVEPTISRDETPDRDDQLMWTDDKIKLKDKERELDEAWVAVRRQFNGKVGIDRMLHRLMKCQYNIDHMLTSIEYELHDLPQPFEEFNEGQQAEFEKLLRKSGLHHGKSFRNMQERFLKGYYLGEIVQYYYDSKHRGCAHTLYHRCQCKQDLIQDFPTVQRYECYNCTKYIWKDIIPERSPRGQSYCSICSLYNLRRRQQRTHMQKLTEPEEKIARVWVDLEKQSQKAVTKQEVFAIMELQRLEKLNARGVAEEVPAQYHNRKQVKSSTAELAELSKKFTPKVDSKCWTHNKWGKEVRRFARKTYDKDEIKEIIQAFKTHGLCFDKVAEALNTKFTAKEIEWFYGTYKEQYRLDSFIHTPKKDIWLGHPSMTQPIQSIASNSSSPEPTGRRKRAGSADPVFEPTRGYVGAPPAKTTRRTRQTQAVEPLTLVNSNIYAGTKQDSATVQP